jgi:glutathione-specific gamma-glutamylcyclotransferase
VKPSSLAHLQTIRRARPAGDLWVFGYASLIWKPECEFIENRAALLRGWHRSLCMKSTLNRGTPEETGLVFALDQGGACRGVALRIAAACADAELERLWAREMVNDVYTPRWVKVRAENATVTALTFTLPRSHPSYVGRLADAELLRIFRVARGRYGTTWDYVWQTHDALAALGVNDAALARIVRLGRTSGLDSALKKS